MKKKKLLTRLFAIKSDQYNNEFHSDYQKQKRNSPFIKSHNELPKIKNPNNKNIYFTTNLHKSLNSLNTSKNTIILNNNYQFNSPYLETEQIYYPRLFQNNFCLKDNCSPFKTKIQKKNNMTLSLKYLELFQEPKEYEFLFMNNLINNTDNFFENEIIEKIIDNKKKQKILEHLKIEKEKENQKIENFVRKTFNKNKNISFLLIEKIPNEEIENYAEMIYKDIINKKEEKNLVKIEMKEDEKNNIIPNKKAELIIHNIFLEFVIDNTKRKIEFRNQYNKEISIKYISQLIYNEIAKLKIAILKMKKLSKNDKIDTSIEKNGNELSITNNFFPITDRNNYDKNILNINKSLNIKHKKKLNDYDLYNIYFENDNINENMYITGIKKEHPILLNKDKNINTINDKTNSIDIPNNLNKNLNNNIKTIKNKFIESYNKKERKKIINNRNYHLNDIKNSFNNKNTIFPKISNQMSIDKKEKTNIINNIIKNKDEEEKKNIIEQSNKLEVQTNNSINKNNYKNKEEKNKDTNSNKKEKAKAINTISEIKKDIKNINNVKTNEIKDSINNKNEKEKEFDNKTKPKQNKNLKEDKNEKKIENIEHERTHEGGEVPTGGPSLGHGEGKRSSDVPVLGKHEQSGETKEKKSIDINKKEILNKKNKEKEISKKEEIKKVKLDERNINNEIKKDNFKDIQQKLDNNDNINTDNYISKKKENEIKDMPIKVKENNIKKNKKEENKKEENKKEESKRKESKKEENKKEENKKEENKKEESKRKENKKEESKRKESKKEENKQEENKKKENKKSENKKAENKNKIQKEKINKFKENEHIQNNITSNSKVENIKESNLKINDLSNSKEENSETINNYANKSNISNNEPNINVNNDITKDKEENSKSKLDNTLNKSKEEKEINKNENININPRKRARYKTIINHPKGKKNESNNVINKKRRHSVFTIDKIEHNKNINEKNSDTIYDIKKDQKKLMRLESPKKFNKNRRRSSIMKAQSNSVSPKRKSVTNNANLINKEEIITNHIKKLIVKKKNKINKRKSKKFNKKEFLEYSSELSKTKKLSNSETTGSAEELTLKDDDIDNLLNYINSEDKTIPEVENENVIDNNINNNQNEKLTKNELLEKLKRDDNEIKKYLEKLIYSKLINKNYILKRRKPLKLVYKRNDGIIFKISGNYNFLQNFYKHYNLNKKDFEESSVEEESESESISSEKTERNKSLPISQIEEETNEKVKKKLIYDNSYLFKKNMKKIEIKKEVEDILKGNYYNEVYEKNGNKENEFDKKKFEERFLESYFSRKKFKKREKKKKKRYTNNKEKQDLFLDETLDKQLYLRRKEIYEKEEKREMNNEKKEQNLDFRINYFFDRVKAWRNLSKEEFLKQFDKYSEFDMKDFKMKRDKEDRIRDFICGLNDYRVTRKVQRKLFDTYVYKEPILIGNYSPDKIIYSSGVNSDEEIKKILNNSIK